MSVPIGPAVPVDDDELELPRGLNPRMALIAASVFLAGDPDCSYSEVLDTADRFLTWLDARS